MSPVGRLERNIAKLEKSIEKDHEKIDELRTKCESHKITKAEFNVKRIHIEEKIRAMDSRMRVLQGGIAKEKRHLEEKTEEKRHHNRRRHFR
jgi:chromosome segregation ATPase